jgi:nicotinamidase/pyrazinamidase
MGVDGGNAVAQGIADLLSADHGFDLVLATQDWHIEPGSHFSTAPDFVDSWPVHCVAGSHGAALNPALAPVTDKIDAMVRKGRYEAAYSGFEGRVVTGSEAEAPEPGPTDPLPGVPLAAWLREREVTGVTVVGIATDFCVRATALDAAAEGFRTTVDASLCAAVHPDNVESVLEEFTAHKINVG